MHSSTLKIIIRYCAAIGLTLIFMFPLFWFGLSSIKPISAMFDIDKVVWFDFKPTLNHYIAIWFGSSISSIRDSMLASILIAIGSTILTLIVSLPTAFALSRMTFRGREWILHGTLSQRFLPPIALIIPLFFMFNHMGLRDSYLAVVIAHSVINMPIAVLLLKSFLDDIPRTIDDMSLIDGATRFQSFRLIILPTIRGGVAATAVLCFVFSWTEFLLSLFLTSTIRTMPIRVSLFDTGTQIPLIAAAGTSAIVPALIFILLVQKHLVRGLTMGAVKE